MADLKIYTRTGDRGTTAIHGHMRVAKTDVRIEANGTLDELNVAIGIARSFMDTDSVWQEELKNIQLTLMTVMSRVATVNSKREDNPNKLPCGMVEGVENLIDKVNDIS
ncbi:MAG: ATP:cob(I)alamin adenosyltransferase, partial [Paramuribaculum sp.]|nr:ATP:cob(I)alamin adenosyltransferase [Paramuribaculum sp.]